MRATEEGRCRAYRRKFAVEVVDEEGAELRQNLRMVSMLLLLPPHLSTAQFSEEEAEEKVEVEAAAAADVPACRAAKTTWWSLDICQISRDCGCYRRDIGRRGDLDIVLEEGRGESGREGARRELNRGGRLKSGFAARRRIAGAVTNGALGRAVCLGGLV